MNFLKKIGKKLLFPHFSIVIILVILSITMLILSFTYWGENNVLSYISYALSLYTLITVCLCFPKIIDYFKKLKDKNKLINRFTTDVYFRFNVLVTFSLIWNISYSVFQLCLGIKHHTIWYYSFAVYYFILAIMRFVISHYTRRNDAGEHIKKEIKLYRFCGILLMVMNLTLGVIIGLIVYQNRTFVHHQITTISMAAYTFTTFFIAIYNVFKYRNYHSPAFMAGKVISFVSALVSMLTLETTMLNTFGGDNTHSNQILLSITGALVLLTILAQAIYMIVNSFKLSKKLNTNQN